MVDNSGTSALISGGTQGLGMAVAECLIRQGCTRLTITGRNADSRRRQRQPACDGADCLFVACDAADTADCEAAVAAAIDHHGHVNALVNSAADTSRGSLTDTTPELFDRHMAINVRGPFFIMQGVVRHLLETGKPGSIVNICRPRHMSGKASCRPIQHRKAGW